MATTPQQPVDTACAGERPLRADARRNRERILEAAREVFARYGAEAQMDDVARSAGVGVGTVYRHFPTKDALLVELVRQKFQLFSAHVRDALEQDMEPFAALVQAMRGIAETAAKDAAAQHVLAGADESVWAQARAEQEELLSATEELVLRCRSAGTIRPEVQATDIGMLMCGVSSSMAARYPGFDWRRHFDFVVETLKPR